MDRFDIKNDCSKQTTIWYETVLLPNCSLQYELWIFICFSPQINQELKNRLNSLLMATQKPNLNGVKFVNCNYCLCGQMSNFSWSVCYYMITGSHVEIMQIGWVTWPFQINWLAIKNKLTNITWKRPIMMKWPHKQMLKFSHV